MRISDHSRFQRVRALSQGKVGRGRERPKVGDGDLALNFARRKPARCFAICSLPVISLSGDYFPSSLWINIQVT